MALQCYRNEVLSGNLPVEILSGRSEYVSTLAY